MRCERFVKEVGIEGEMVSDVLLEKKDQKVMGIDGALIDLLRSASGLTCKPLPARQDVHSP